ncbi:type II secretion system protein [Clostridium sp. OF09-36]|uniref:type II secretion system protein n=1 Tax=Clostridium sp. OF09-36 TaxID=2292310 RepID=UPI0011C21A76|nr:type II secretion system protein [Clostridium sp. OF09-36]
MEYRSYTKKHRSGAFTLAEFLVVIAITLILAGVSFVAAIRYQSSLRRMEMDRTAKEIFLAAQNNLSLAKSGGVMERLLHQYGGNDTENTNGTLKTESNASADKIGIALSAITGSTGADADDLYCILHQPGEGAGNTTEGIRARLLPFGSIDETVRTDGSYLIVYAPGTGVVREVWYSDRYIFQGTAAEFSELSGLTEDPKKRERFYGEAVGYYAGASLTEPERKEPEQMEMKVAVYNKDVLYVEVETPSGVNGLKLWVEGAASGAKGWIDLNRFTQDERVLTKGAGSVYDVILDDISIQGARFADLRGDLRSDQGGNDIALIPGEDICIYAEAVTESGNKAASPVCQTNSLFQKVANGKIVVSNIRHLENLDRRVSDFHPAANEQKLGLSSPAEQPGAYVVSQSEDMSWTDYRSAVVREIHSSHASAVQAADNIPVYYKIYKKQGEVLTEEWTGTAPGCYAPLEPEFDLVYEGNGKKISELVVNTPGAGGCFGTVSKNLTVTDLKVVHPVITADDHAGG